jgi:hypothetical protein
VGLSLRQADGAVPICFTLQGYTLSRNLDKVITLGAIRKFTKKGGFERNPNGKGSEWSGMGVGRGPNDVVSSAQEMGDLAKKVSKVPTPQKSMFLGRYDPLTEKLRKVTDLDKHGVLTVFLVLRRF